MINPTTCTATSQSCYVDMAPPGASNQLNWFTALWPLYAPSAPPEPPDGGNKTALAASDDLEAMIRRIVREELGKLRIAQSDA